MKQHFNYGKTLLFNVDSATEWSIGSKNVIKAELKCTSLETVPSLTETIQAAKSYMQSRDEAKLKIQGFVTQANF